MTAPAAQPDHSEHPADSIASAIESYRPARMGRATLEAAEVVLPVARDWVGRTAPDSPAQAVRLMRTLTTKLMWDHRRGTPLDAEAVLHYQNVRRWMADSRDEGRDNGWLSNALSQLRRVGRAMGAGGWPQEEITLERRPKGNPYSAEQESSFRQQAAQRHRRNRNELAWVVAGALGCGMAGVEIRQTCGDDLVHLGEDRIGVRVAGKHPRLVPVRKDYTALVAMAAEAAPDGRTPLIADTSGRVYYLATQLAERDGPLSLARARLTWLSAHLRAGTPLHALYRSAGAVWADTLTHLLAHTAADLDDLTAAREGLGA